MGLSNTFLAITIAKENNISLIFSDIKIEGELDGIDTIKILQNLYQIPTIFITAYNDDETIIKASEVLYDAFLLKPYREDELKTQIKLILSKYKLLEQNNKTVTIDTYEYCKNEKKLFINEKEIELSKKEQIFLSLLVNNISSIIPYHIIDETVWFDEMVSDNTRRTFIYRFRAKLKRLNLKAERNQGIGLY